MKYPHMFWTRFYITPWHVHIMYYTIFQLFKYIQLAIKMIIVHGLANGYGEFYYCGCI